MTRVKAGLLVLAGLAVAAGAGGVVGAGAAIALVKTAYNGPVDDTAGAELVVHSTQLGETVTLRIRLPVEYAPQPDRRFPVVWVLDGPAQGSQVFTTMQVLSRIGVAEPAIVVEVPDSGAGRTTDLTPPPNVMTSVGGQGDRFLRFLADEAIPAVAEAFRTDSVRVLVGHSLGGLFALYAFAERPSLFGAYFAFSPSVWVGDEAVVPLLQEALQRSGLDGTFLYASLGSDEGNRMLDGFEAVRRTLESYAPEQLTWRMDVTPDADHLSNPVLSFPVAARLYWSR
ncbi:MAG: alpha/beta hydrolase-fold protein [Candidatus Palauibacterales bacterium]|jgi:predicted alpha/beta superfamily hydrolase|nr:alpha/beta hydrolase-fold protein [Candidatus Palauibacterales bacterium]MDP2481659.1 alpha/beta hydrolase-fold protein [Candidatus Palauibacterales bacterium]